ncbi:uncharacterized protein G2W53_034872 [Senna tora]|uniref:Uncharacterized protein n=1 Tax=Senna tora TaxID=362788 RepID=A0A834T230_9FABA|nr:uncharacterized protein G2W53_034872 [Senna tora]
MTRSVTVTVRLAVPNRSAK